MTHPRSKLLFLLTLLASCQVANEEPISTVDTQDTSAPFLPLDVRPGVHHVTLQQTIHSSVETRHFSISAPADYGETSSYPLLFVFHGNASGAPEAEPERGMLNAVAGLVDSNEVVAIAPRGYDNCWQLGPENSSATTAEELAFIEGLIAQSHVTPGLDASRIYAIGTSNGAAFSHYLAANTPHFSGIGAIVSMLDEGMVPDATSPPLRVIQLLNLKDPLIPYEGGESPVGHTFMSAEESARAWAEHNGCDATPSIIETDTMTTTHYTGCNDDSAVTNIAVLPVPWSEECDQQPPPAGVDCGPTHTVDNSYFADSGGTFGYIWRFFNE